MPRKCTELADFTNRMCAGCKAHRGPRGTGTNCGLGFETITHPYPRRMGVYVTRPVEPCLRPKTYRSYLLCRDAARELGKDIEPLTPKGCGIIASPPRDHTLGGKRAKSNGVK